MTNPAEFTWEMALRASSPKEDAADVEQDERRLAFARLVRDHAGVLHGVASRLLATPADAEDAVQETFLRAWRGLAAYRHEAAARTWLFRILLNACHDRRRRFRLRRLERSAPPPRPADPARSTARRDLLDRVFGAVDELPLRQRECLLLRVQAGLSYEEIADLLGIGVGTVKTHLVQGRRALLRRFGRELDA